MNIRTAERRDLSAMLDIYNYEVKNGTATFDVEPRAGAAGEAWFAAHNTGNLPLRVAEEDGKVLGYASLSPYRDFDAYLQTVELSVYVAPESRGRGIASALMEAVLRLASRGRGHAHGRFRHRGRQRGERPSAREIRLYLLRDSA